MNGTSPGGGAGAELANKIARLVEERGWNQEDFARISKLNRHTVRQILQGGPKRRLRNASGKAETQQEISESRHLWSLFHGTARRSSSAQRSSETTKARLANCGRSPKRAKVAYNIVYILVSTEIVGFS